MDFGIAGKTALLMSSTRGLGFGSAAALVAEGVNVVINGRNAERGIEAISRLGGKAHFVRCLESAGDWDVGSTLAASTTGCWCGMNSTLPAFWDSRGGAVGVGSCLVRFVRGNEHRGLSGWNDCRNSGGGIPKTPDSTVICEAWRSHRQRGRSMR